MSRRAARAAALLLAAALAALPFAAAADGESDREAMAATNALYEDGKYAQAARSYQQLVDRGYEDAALYYNLGNAYFKDGDLGRAILNYLRAERIAPRDADVRANLEFARLQRVDELDSQGASLAGATASALSKFTTVELGVSALVLWILAAAGGLAIMFGRPAWRSWTRPAAMTAAVLLALGLAAFGGRLYVDYGSDAAVIVAEEVEVASGPGAQYAAEFTLYAGAETELMEKRGSWAKIALPGRGMHGWVPIAAMEEVDLPPHEPGA